MYMYVVLSLIPRPALTAVGKQKQFFSKAVKKALNKTVSYVFPTAARICGYDLICRTMT